MSKTEQLRPEINRLLCFIKDKEQEIDNILWDNRLGVSKVGKNTINKGLWELYREVERVTKILDDFHQIQIQTR